MANDRLSHLRCEPCTEKSAALTRKEAESLLASVPLWKIVTKDGVNRLQRVFTFKNFRDALHFTNIIGAVAEEANHHPDILTEWGKVTVCWWTHSVQGLHKNDFIMAAKTDASQASQVDP